MIRENSIWKNSIDSKKNNFKFSPNKAMKSASHQTERIKSITSSSLNSKVKSMKDKNMYPIWKL